MGSERQKVWWHWHWYSKNYERLLKDTFQILEHVIWRTMMEMNFSFTIKTEKGPQVTKIS